MRLTAGSSPYLLRQPKTFLEGRCFFNESVGRPVVRAWKVFVQSSSRPKGECGVYVCMYIYDVTRAMYDERNARLDDEELGRAR